MFGGYCYITDRQSQVLESGNWPRDPRAGVRSLGVGEVGVGGKESLVPDIVGYGVFSVPKLVLVC